MLLTIDRHTDEFDFHFCRFAERSLPRAVSYAASHRRPARDDRDTATHHCRRNTRAEGVINLRSLASDVLVEADEDIAGSGKTATRINDRAASLPRSFAFMGTRRLGLNDIRLRTGVRRRVLPAAILRPFTAKRRLEREVVRDNRRPSDRKDAASRNRHRFRSRPPQEFRDRGPASSADRA